METQEYKKGRELCERLHGKHSGGALVAMLEEICPDYVDMTNGMVLCRNHRKTRLIDRNQSITLACLLHMPWRTPAASESLRGGGSWFGHFERDDPANASNCGISCSHERISLRQRGAGRLK
ncbi:hypothetical protein P8936_08605 [Edaphobacter paludis]|uniref:Uncharacterized protein n=1 Tax=Edaphobacter paludis TaxID=3035702 RepID=A0AAU7DD23_9BACT